MTARAIKYAEEDLAVHAVWERVQLDMESLDQALGDLDKALDSKRSLSEKYEDRLAQLVGEKRGLHASMSDTRFRSELKGWERKDGDLHELRTKQNEVQSRIQGVEYDIKMLEVRIKAGCSRMEQLGGYFHYLAAVKNQAETTNKREQNDTSESR